MILCCGQNGWLKLPGREYIKAFPAEEIVHSKVLGQEDRNVFWALKGGLCVYEAETNGMIYTFHVCMGWSVCDNGLARGHNVGAFEEQVMGRKFTFQCNSQSLRDFEP